MSEAIKDDIKLTEELKILIELSLNEENRDVACNITGLVYKNLILLFLTTLHLGDRQNDGQF